MKCPKCGSKRILLGVSPDPTVLALKCARCGTTGGMRIAPVKVKAEVPQEPLNTSPGVGEDMPRAKPPSDKDNTSLTPGATFSGEE
jgi:DNA-directed RNA polymerase subunit RPC12/RpoP